MKLVIVSDNSLPIEISISEIDDDDFPFVIDQLMTIKWGLTSL